MCTSITCRFARVVVAPHPLEQLVPGEHLARVTQQEGHWIEGLWLHRQRHAIAQQAVTAEVDLDVADFHVRGRLLGHRGLLGAAAYNLF